MTLFTTVETFDIQEWATSLILMNRHRGLGVLTMRMSLASLFIHEMDDDEFESEIIGRGEIKVDDEAIISARESESEDENNVLIGYINLNLSQLECDTVHFSDPSLHSDIINLSEHEKFATESDMGGETTSMVDSFQVGPNGTGVTITDMQEL